MAFEQMRAHPTRVKSVPGKAVHRVEVNHAGAIQDGLDEVRGGLGMFAELDTDLDQVVRCHQEITFFIDLVATGELARDFLEELYILLASGGWPVVCATGSSEQTLEEDLLQFVIVF